MKSNKIYRAVSMILAMALIVVLSSCNKSTETNSSSDSVEQIDVFSTSTASTASGVYDNTWWGNIIKEDIGISLNVLPSGDKANEKLQAYMAGGELPDIIIFQKTSDVENAIRGNMLVNLDDHISSLPNVTKNAGTALQYCRDNISNDTDSAYTITSNVGPADASIVEPNWGPYLRWDIYEQIGYPEINSWDDYLTVLKEMQEFMPVTEDGSNTYGITLWKDWDNYSMFLATELGPTLGIDCGDQLSPLPFLQVDFNTGETKNILDPDSMYIQALNFYYKANQMGLVDPDSLTQTYETAKSKLNDGQVFFSWWSWFHSSYNTTERTNADTPTGFKAVVPTNTKLLIFGDNEIGKNWCISISSATKKLDACLKYIDYMYSTDGLQKLYNGPEGVTWETNTEGTVTLTDTGREYAKDLTKTLPEGGTLSEGINLIGFNGLSIAFDNSNTNEALCYTCWDSTKEYNLTNQTSLDKKWASITGSSTTLEYLKANDMTTELPLAINLLPSMTDEISTTASRIGDIIKSNSWKMIFAKDDAEFQSLYEDMVYKAEGLGMDTVFEWSLSGWNAALAKASEYEK